MDTKRTFVVATDHTRKFEYCARSHISSPLPVRRRHQIMPNPRSATGPQRPCKRLHSAFSWPRHSAAEREILSDQILCKVWPTTPTKLRDRRCSSIARPGKTRSKKLEIHE